MEDKLAALTDDDYKALYSELYAKDSNGRRVSFYRVPLDQDPSIDPLSINKKLADVQSYKDRMVVILNDAIRNESYCKTALKDMESRFESEVGSALTTDAIKNSGNAGIQKAVAMRVASKALVVELFAGEGKYEDKISLLTKKYAEAGVFLKEVENLYENLDKTSMALAVQLKSVMMNMRLYNPLLPKEEQYGS